MKNKGQQKIKTTGRDRIVKSGNVLEMDENGRLPVDEDAMPVHGSVTDPHDG
ncbi:MAG TPA: hypothetical protein VN366_13490 [Feifaniaceae bacterium]|nr:hypothetical protein [Feifaniaceae bacterium]